MRKRNWKFVALAEVETEIRFPIAVTREEAINSYVNDEGEYEIDEEEVVSIDGVIEVFDGEV